MRSRGRVDVEGFWRNDYTIVRGVYSPEEIERVPRVGFCLASPCWDRDLLANARLRSVLVDGRLVEIARRILGRDGTLYAGDSSFSSGTRRGGWYKDNADRKDSNAPD